MAQLKARRGGVSRHGRVDSPRGGGVQPGDAQRGGVRGGGGLNGDARLVLSCSEEPIDPSVFVTHTRLVPARLVWQHQIESAFATHGVFDAAQREILPLVLVRLVRALGLPRSGKTADGAVWRFRHCVRSMRKLPLEVARVHHDPAAKAELHVPHGRVNTALPSSESRSACRLHAPLETAADPAEPSQPFIMPAATLSPVARMFRSHPDRFDGSVIEG